MDEEAFVGHEPITETVRIVDGYIEIFGGATGYFENAPYDYRMDQLETAHGLARYLRQISQKSWAHRLLMKEIITTIADWFDSAITRELEQMKQEAKTSSPTSD